MEWLGRVGEIREIFRSKCYVVFDWTIPNIFSMPIKIGPVYYSPEIKFLDEIWFLGIHRNDRLVAREWIGLEIWRSDKRPRKFVSFSVGMRNAEGIEEVIHRDLMYPDKCRFYTINKFLLSSVLLMCKAQLAPSDALTVTCTLWGNTPVLEEGRLRSISAPPTDSTIVEGAAKEYEDEEDEKLVSRETQTEEESDDGEDKTQVSRGTQTEDESSDATAKERCQPDANDRTQVSCDTQTEDIPESDAIFSHLDVEALLILRKDLKHLLYSGDDHDVILQVKSREFRAHRNMLRARSSVLASMLEDKSSEGILAIDDCDPDAFGEFLEYVYTGELLNLSAGNAMGLYYAGEKYEFPLLKEACVQFMKTSLSTTTVSQVVSMAVKNGDKELLESAMAFFAEHLEEIMGTEEWTSFLIAHPIQANEMCLKAVKSRLYGK